MRFIVYGAGAIGSTIGGHLFRTGHDTVLVANPQHVDAIRRSGLKLVTSDEEYQLKIPAVKTAQDLIPFREDDVLLLTVKSQHTPICLGQLKNAGASRTLPVFCCQNSILNEAYATRVFDRVYGVVVVVPAVFLKPGEVLNPITGNAGGLLEVGLYPRGSDELMHTVRSALKDGFITTVNDWVMKAKAGKCLGNLGNALDAITGGKGDRESYMIEACREAEQVWKAAGIEWETRNEFNKRMSAIRGRMQRKPSSSRQSLMRGTGNIETEQLNGEIVKLGKMLGILTPFNELLWRIANEMARNREKPGKYTVKELMLMVRRESKNNMDL